MIDLRTLLVLLAVADLLVAAALWIGVGRGAREGLSHWACALVVRALAAAILLLAGDGQADGAVALAAGLLALSVTLQGGAVLAFARRPMPGWIHTAALAALAIPVQLVVKDVGLALLFAGMVLGLLMLGVAALARHALPAGAARRLVAASFVVAGAMGMLRAAGAAFEAHPAESLLAPSGLAASTLLILFAAMLAATLGMLFLHKERAEAEAVRVASLDPLTGAYNRRAFPSLAGQALAAAQRGGEPLSLVMVDLDHFGDVVERHGAAVGDALLARFADLTRSTLRREDIFVRMGGDVFVVVLPGVPGPGAVVVAGRLRRLVSSAPLPAAGQEIALTVSMGLSARLDEAPDEAETVETLLARATSALRLAKHRGRDRVVALSLGSSIAA